MVVAEEFEVELVVGVDPLPPGLAVGHGLAYVDLVDDPGGVFHDFEDGVDGEHFELLVVHDVGLIELPADLGFDGLDAHLHVPHRIPLRLELLLALLGNLPLALDRMEREKGEQHEGATRSE